MPRFNASMVVGLKSSGVGRSVFGESAKAQPPRQNGKWQVAELKSTFPAIN